MSLRYRAERVVGRAEPEYSLRMRFLLLCALAVGCKSATAPFDSDDTDVTDTDTDTTGIPPLTAPESDGPYTSQMFIDDIPGADVPIRVRAFVPDTDLGPVALIFPGFLIPPTEYDSYAQHLASNGYTTLIVNLPGGLGNDRRTHRQMTQDVGLALNWLEVQAGTRLQGIDPFNVYAVGHSLGGKIVLNRATTDQRIRAVVALDPIDSSPFDDPVEYPSVTPELMGSLTIPLAFIGETNNDEGCAPAAQNFDAYYQAAVGAALKVDTLQANHLSWIDTPDCGAICDACGPGTDDPLVTKRMSRGVIYSFFEHARLARPGARDHFTTLTEYVGGGMVTVEFKGGL